MFVTLSECYIVLVSVSDCMCGLVSDISSKISFSECYLMLVTFSGC